MTKTENETAAAPAEDTEDETSNQEILTEVAEVAKKTMTGDLRDIMLDIVKHDKKTWKEKNEKEQQATIDKIVFAVEGAVTQAIKIMKSDGRKAIVARLDQVTIKDGIKAVLKISQSDEQRHHLVDSTGLSVLVIIADPEEYNGEQAPAKPDPDQTPLPIEESNEDQTNGQAEGDDEEESEDDDSND